jgi:hypothetical protein
MESHKIDMIDDDFKYLSDCCVCHDPVSEDEADSCENCGDFFHVNNCGNWHGEQYLCQNCDY